MAAKSGFLTHNKNELQRSLACLILCSDDDIRTHGSPGGFGNHTCVGWNGLPLSGLDWALCLMWTENGSFCRCAWTELQQRPAGKHVSSVINVLWLWEQLVDVSKSCMYQGCTVICKISEYLSLANTNFNFGTFIQIMKNIVISQSDDQTYQRNGINSCVAWKLSLTKVKSFLLPPLSIFLSLRAERKYRTNKIRPV